MDAIRSMMVFATVVDLGSMRRAGQALDISTSAVSQHVRRLEREFQVPLLRRTTRRLALTDAGEAFYQRCRELREAASAARQQLIEARDAPEGLLTISVPTMLGSRLLAGALAPLLLAYRQLSLRLLVSDAGFDPVNFRVDLAVVVGSAPDSTLVVHPITSWELVLCASPQYLGRQGVPVSVEELQHHDLLVLEQPYVPTTFELQPVAPGNTPRRVTLRGRHACNSQATLRRMALDGLGVSVQAAEEIADDLAQGRLVRVLPQWSLGRVPVFALTTPRGHLVAKVRVALEAIGRYLRQMGAGASARDAVPAAGS